MPRRTEDDRLSNARSVESPVTDGLLDIQVAVSDLDVKTTGGVGTRPGLKVDGCPLAAEIGQGYQVTDLTLLAFGESVHHYHESPPNRT
jgi:hypothetical protein